MKDRRSVAVLWTFEPAPPRPGRCEVSSLAAATDRPEVSPGAGGFRLSGGLPVPRQQRIEFMVFGSLGDDAFKYIDKPGQWLDPVQLRRLDQCHDDRPV